MDRPKYSATAPTESCPASAQVSIYARLSPFSWGGAASSAWDRLCRNSFSSSSADRKQLLMMSWQMLERMKRLHSPDAALSRSTLVKKEIRSGSPSGIALRSASGLG